MPFPAITNAEELLLLITIHVSGILRWYRFIGTELSQNKRDTSPVVSGKNRNIANAIPDGIHKRRPHDLMRAARTCGLT